jgi:hypothetical protein
VIIDVDLQGQAVFQEGGWQKIQVSQQGFAFVNLGAGEDATAIIQHVEQREKVLAIREPPMGRGVQLPQLTNLTTLPSPNGSRWTVVRFGVSEVMLDSPTPNLSPRQLVLAEP